MTEELLPCPFCGAEPDWKRWEVNNIWQIKIFCDSPGCHVYPSIFGNEETMTKIWNTRAQPKYKRVDLFDILKEIRSSNQLVDRVQFKTICDIKSKYGDLYTMGGIEK